MNSKNNATSSPTTIIFFGAPRSGTSVISEIIMRHSDLAFPSQYQSKFPFYPSINFIRRVFDNSLWRVHGQKRQLNKVKFFNTFVFRPSEAYPMWNSLVPNNINFGRDFFYKSTAEASTQKKMINYFQKLINYQGKKILSFKITGPSRIEYLSSIFPNAKFVRIKRDPLATINSLLKVEFWMSRGKEKLWWTGPYNSIELSWAENYKDDPIAMTAFQLKKILDITEEEISKIKPPILTVDYVEFVKQPEHVISNILNFADLSHDPACYDYLKENTIYNRNQNVKSNFTMNELSTINKIFQQHFPENDLQDTSQ